MSLAVIEIRDSDNSLTGTIQVQEGINLTYGVQDIKNISPENDRWRGGSYSKEFLVPASNANNKFLKTIYDTNIQDSKDIKGEKDCILKVDGIPYIRGKFRIDGVDFVQGVKYYRCLVVGDNVDWVTDAKNTALNSLDWGTHTYNKTTIQDSWDSGWPAIPYYYGLVNYGKWKQGNKVQVEDLRPHIPAKAIIQKFFTGVGYTLSSTFMGLSDFVDLYYCYVGNNWKHPQSVIDDNTYKSTTSGQIKAYDAKPFGTSLTDTFKINFTSTDNATIFNTTTDRFTVAQGGRYTFDYYLNIKSKQYMPELMFLQVRKNGILLDRRGFALNGVDASTSTHRIFTGNTGETADYLFAIGDVIEIWFEFNISEIVNMADVEITIQSGSYVQSRMSNEITRGSSITLKNYLQDTPVIDIINGLTHCFNLVWKTDVSTKTVTVEPFDSYTDLTSTSRDGFYKTITDYVDWTGKYDASKNPKISFLQEYSRKIKFQYKKDDNDAFLSNVNDAAKKSFGSYEHEFSRFKTGSKTTENPHFAFTYYIRDESISQTKSRVFAPLIARLWKDPEDDQTIPPYDNDFAPRLLYKNYSVQGTGIKWNWEGVWTSKVPSLLSWGGDVLSSNFDLRFNSSTGLVKTFYATQLNIIEKGIFVEAYFNLTSSDILKAERSTLLRKPVYLSQPTELKGYYLINEILDFDPINRQTVKVELIKFENKQPVTINSVQNDPFGSGPFGPPSLVPLTSDAVVSYTTNAPSKIYAQIDRGDGELIITPVYITDPETNKRKEVISG